MSTNTVGKRIVNRLNDFANSLESDPFAKMTDDELREEFRRRLSVYAGSLVSLAEVVGAMVRRGLDLSKDVNPILLDTLRKIDSKQIYAPAAEKYMHLPIWSKIKPLVIDDQKEIAEKGTVELVVRRGDSFDVRMTEVSALTKNEARLVFAGGRLRTRSEQTAILEDEQPEDDDDPMDGAVTTMRIALTVSDRKKITKRAKEKGKTESDIVVEALRRYL